MTHTANSTADNKQVTLTQEEWNTVTAALLCLQDRDTDRGAHCAAARVRSIRYAIANQVNQVNPIDLLRTGY